MRLERVVQILRKMNSYLTGSSLDIFFNGEVVWVNSGFVLGRVEVSDKVDLKGKLLKVDFDVLEKVFVEGGIEDVLVEAGRLRIDKGSYEVEVAVVDEVVLVEREIEGEGEEVDLRKMKVSGFEMAKLWKRSLVDLLDVVWVKSGKVISISSDYLMVGDVGSEADMDMSRWVWLFIDDVQGDVRRVVNYENVVRLEFDSGYVDVVKRVVNELNFEIVKEVEERFVGERLRDFDRMVVERFDGEVFLLDLGDRYGVEVQDKRYFVRSKERGMKRYYIEDKFLDYLLQSEGVVVKDGIMKLKRGDVSLYVMLKEGF